MSGSVEVPDIVTGITNAIGLNRLWENPQQTDAEKRKSNQKAESAEDEAHRTKQTPDDHGEGGGGGGEGVAPVSLKQEREREKHIHVDHDDDVAGIPRAT